MEDLLVQERPLHEYDLDFPLDDLSSLPSIYLALVRFHPNASEYDKDRATILFLQRRTDWMIQERERIRKEEEELRNRRDVKPRVDVNKEEEGDEPVAIEVRKPRPEEIVIDDTDEEENVVVVRVDKGKGKAKEQERRSKKRKSLAPSPAAETRPVKRVSPVSKQTSSSKTSTSMATTSPRRRPPGFPNPITKLPSFKRFGAGPSSAISTAIVLPSTNGRDQHPPNHLPQRDAAGLVFVPNPTATRAHDLPLFLVREDPAKDSNGRPQFDPPPPGPSFTPMPSVSAEAPAELVKQLTTIVYPKLGKRITCHLLFLFLARTQQRFPPRPIAMRKTQFGIFVAFKSKKDAEQMIELSQGKSLPDVEEENDERTLDPYLLEEDSILARNFWFDSRVVIGDKIKGWTGDGLDWKWGELSDEVRREWQGSGKLPRARVMPRRDVVEDKFVSEEYQEEVAILNDPYSFVDTETAPRSIKQTRDRRRTLNQIKAELYLRRCQAWNEWYVANPGSEDFATRPPFPTMPHDECCMPRLEAIEEAARSRTAEGILGPTRRPRLHRRKSIPSVLEITERYKEAFNLAGEVGTEARKDWTEAFKDHNDGMTIEEFTESVTRMEEIEAVLDDLAEITKEHEEDMRKIRGGAAASRASTADAGGRGFPTASAKSQLQTKTTSTDSRPIPTKDKVNSTTFADQAARQHLPRTATVLASNAFVVPSSDLPASTTARYLSDSSRTSDGRNLATASSRGVGGWLNTKANKQLGASAPVVDPPSQPPPAASNIVVGLNPSRTSSSSFPAAIAEINRYELEQGRIISDRTSLAHVSLGKFGVSVGSQAWANKKAEVPAPDAEPASQPPPPKTTTTAVQSNPFLAPSSSRSTASLVTNISDAEKAQRHLDRASLARESLSKFGFSVKSHTYSSSARNAAL